MAWEFCLDGWEGRAAQSQRPSGLSSDVKEWSVLISGDGDGRGTEAHQQVHTKARRRCPRQLLPRGNKPSVARSPRACFCFGHAT